MDFDEYPLKSEIYDEWFHVDGTPRESTRTLYESFCRLPPGRVTGIQERVARSFMHESISFTNYHDDEITEQIMPIDCIPRVLSANEWNEIETGLKQRITALNLFLDDIYNAAKIIADGVIPREIVRECPQYRIEMQGVSVPNRTWVGICGTDVLRTNEGFHVLEDNLRVPSGVSYMLANRKAVKSNIPRTYRLCGVRDIEHYGALLKRTLQELAPNAQSDPAIAVLTPGVYNAAFYEHMFLAYELGAALVEGQDMLMNDGHIYMRTTSGLRKVDVIYRRVDDDFIDPLVFKSESMIGVPGLMHAYKRGTVSIVNAPGTGVADDKSVYAYVPDIIRYYLSEEPHIPNVETYLCRRPEELEYTLDNLDKLVVKTVGGSGGYDMLVGPHASTKERNEYSKMVRENPKNFISQPVLALSCTPCLIDGHPVPRHVDLRPFLLTGRETRTVPGTFSRVALREGSIVVNSSQGGGGKDVWVLKR